MSSVINEIYRGYWVAQCRYTQNGEKFTGYMTLAGTTADDAVAQMRHYFAQYQAQYSFAQYETLTPAISFVEASQQLELPLLRQLREQHAEHIPAVLVDERNLTHPLPSEKGDIHYQAGAPAFIANTTLYLVIDSGEYYRQTARHLVPALYGSQLPWQSLYQGETQANLEDSAPYLVELQPNSAGQQWLAHYLSLPNKATLGLFISSFKPFAEVHRQLRKLTYLRNPRLNSWNFFRFYDTAHFIPFIESLSHGQLLNVVSGVLAFYGYSADYPDGVKITVEADYLFDKGRREALFINDRLYHHYARLTMMQTVNKAKKLIEQYASTSLFEAEGGALNLDQFCLHAANHAFLRDINQMQALFYYLLARYASYQNEALWQTASEQAKPYEANSVTFNYQRYLHCLPSQGVTA